MGIGVTPDTTLDTGMVTMTGDTQVLIQPPDTTLDTGMETMTGDTQVLIQLGQVGQDTTLVDGRSLPIFLALLVLLESQGRPRAARLRVARQRRVVPKYVGKMSSIVFHIVESFVK